ncbi:MAG: hypothetical protein AAF357_03235 [Verrucomicrobiota bacterium]
MNPAPNTAEELIAYLHDELEPDVRADLEARLIENESLRRTLIELSTEEAALADWAKAERASAALDDETFAADPIPEANVTRLAPPSPLAGWWAAAAILVISALGFFAVNQNPPASASLAGVAHLVASVDAQWEGAHPLLNHPMATGSYELKSGAADLLFADGARVTVSGPAVFDLRSSRHLHLHGGNLVAQIPDEALGFIVTSPQSEVVDLGTEFGLSVGATGLTDVHVLDGLVEVLPAEGNPASQQSSGVMITEGEARRFSDDPDINGSTIPVSSRNGLVGKQRSSEIGLDMLRGSVRVVDHISRNDLFDVSEGFNWIDLAVEQRDVPLNEPLPVSIDSPGSYRNFVNPEAVLPAGQTVSSYLLHFRPNSFSYVSGVIRFDQPIVGVLCTGNHLRQTDAIFGVDSVYYPTKASDFQGLEPHGTTPPEKQASDEIILSQDRTTISIRTFAGIDRGYDQIRILTQSKVER